MGSLPHKSITRIAIIGAGPSGIATAKYLVAEKAFSKIDILEQRHDIGGVWNLTSNTRSARTAIPQLDPNYNNTEQPSPSAAANGPGGHVPAAERAADRFETPLYDLLETNIPKELMQYANRPFDEHLPLFPRRESVLDYCKKYAEDVRPLIRFGCQVVDVRVTRPDGSGNGSHFGGGGWTVTSIDEATQKRNSENYDAIVVASGHFSVPFIPSIEGIAAWCAAYPGSVLHSKAYRNANPFTGKKAIVVGNSASGVDIGAQIGKVCKQPLLQSSRSENIFASGGGLPWREDIPEIVEFLDPATHNRSVLLADGQVIRDLDTILFATGYFYSFPFLHLKRPIITHGFRTLHLYHQLFHITYPTLAFPVLAQRIAPFPMAENQAAIIARVWSGRLSLPPEAEMRAWEKAMLEERGDGKGMHTLNFPQDVDQLNMLYDWAAFAPTCEGLENGGVGLMGTRWDERLRWMRSQFPAIKRAYAERGEDRFSVKTVEELGFDFERWRREAQMEESATEVPAETAKGTREGVVEKGIA
jgi:cation diffusion facilitator CzcD-associated flavoprotein CzcO